MVKKKINNFSDLKVWQLSHHLVKDIYNITKNLPSTEAFGLSSQLRRASVSFPANIVEGYYRDTTKELIRYLYNARGSCGEVIYYIILIYELDYIEITQYEELSTQYKVLIKKLSAMINSLKKRV